MSKYRKSVAAAIAALISTLAAALTEADRWVPVGIAWLSTIAVYFAPNAAESPRSDDAGQSVVMTVCVVLAVLAVLMLLFLLAGKASVDL